MKRKRLNHQGAKDANEIQAEGKGSGEISEHRYAVFS